jgi:hypothetical protein
MGVHHKLIRFSIKENLRPLQNNGTSHLDRLKFHHLVSELPVAEVLRGLPQNRLGEKSLRTSILGTRLTAILSYYKAMTNRRAELEHLYYRCLQTEQPWERLGLIQEGERMAEADEESLFSFRMLLANTGFDVDKPELSLAAFTWCLYTFDHNRNLSHHLHWMLMKFKSVVWSLNFYPQTTLKQLDDISEEFRTRLLRAGYSARSYYELRSDLAIDSGRLEEAVALIEVWRRMRKDVLSSNDASEANKLVYVYSYARQWETAIEISEPLRRGVLRSDTIPNHTYSMIAKSYIKLGDLDQGLYYAHEGVLATEGSLEYLEETYELMEDFALLGRYGSGIELMERRMSWLKLVGDPFDRYRFYASALMLLKPALKENPDLQLRLSTAYLQENHLKDNRADTLLQYYEKEAHTLGTAFNRRNGNTHWTDYFL